MTAKNAEGYPDPTAEEAIRHVMRGGKLDYTSFRTYEELQDYTIEHGYKNMAKGKPKRKPFGMNSSLADATQVMRQLPVSAMLSSIEMQINILQERGVEIRDWENKDRVLKQVRILGGKAYFLAEDKPRD